jgi:late competence protein required for DNA uptake (superfamily II DNA/RNA helicase)
MQCARCGLTVKENEAFNLHGKVLCEDCCMYETNPPKACDPLAVVSATSIRKELGQLGTAGLTELQKQIYRVIEQKKQITKEELLKIVGIKTEELESQFAILRHCELIRAFKEGDKVYLTKW